MQAYQSFILILALVIQALFPVDDLTTLCQYDAADRIELVNGVGYTWDDNGNLLADGVNTFTYDTANRLTAVNGQGTSFTYAYDGLGNRYQQTANGQTTTYALDLAGGLSQVLSDGENTYLYGRDRLAQQSAGGTGTFLPDGLGSVRQIANASGMAGDPWAYDPFGGSIGSSGSSAYGFAGEWTDGTGLQYLRARYYSPEQGRFITRDPFPGLPSQPSTLNAYAYVTNDPINLTDPSGQIAPILLIAGAGFLAGAGYNVWQQTNGFSNWCNFDIMTSLAWGAGGAAAAFSLVTFSVGFAGLLGAGLQGAALGLYGLGFGTSAATSLWIGGSTIAGVSSLAMAWLFTGTNYPKLIIDSARMPNIANNIRNAQANGAPRLLTRTQNPAIMSINRQAACAGFCGQGSPDEYPFASTYEGGAGAFVSGVPMIEQNIQGGVLNQFYRINGIWDGDKFWVIVK